ncbi:hypothetical protein ACFQ3Y_24890 [Paenibacillus motobuensis]|uniref:hypothetical protein n=1 Tax=Paenibacillus motobuensis TaxID=295324 RepID=UPI0036335EF6
MDVLNTYGGSTSGLVVFLAIILGIIAIAILIFAIIEVETFGIFIGLCLAIFAIVLAFKAHEPVRHEVTLRPGYVIDAAKYKLIEQRGQIYVIEERKGAE